MQVLFRADASVAIGAGHVVRCAALADALQQQGAAITFLTRPASGDLADWLAGRGFDVVRLPDAAASEAQDAQQCLAALAPEFRADWLVADHYALGAGWHGAMRGVTGRIAVIDDLADRPLDADLLINPGIAATAGDYTGKLPATCRLALGSRYALLRAQFAATTPPSRDGGLRRILVCAGGSDAHDATAAIVAATLAAGISGLALDVVVGAGYPHLEALRARYAGMPEVNIHVAAEDMATRMAAADLFIGAGGGMTWERACLGLPGLTVAVADNQRPQCLAVAELGADLFLGEPSAAAWSRIAPTLQALAAQPALLRVMGRTLASLCDGRGSLRLARMMALPALALRAATAADCDAMYAWRNHPDTRRHATGADAIDLDAHRKWYAAVLNDPQRRLLVATRADSGEAVGVLRYDLRGETATISIYLVPGMSGLGLGPALIDLGDAWLRAECPAARVVEARIETGNHASGAAFIQAGYTPQAGIYVKRLVTS